MGEQDLLRRMLRIAVRETVSDSARAEAILSWCQDNSASLGLPAPSESGSGRKAAKAKRAGKGAAKRGRAWTWKRLRAALASMPLECADWQPAPLGVGQRLADLLTLPVEEARLIELVVAFDRRRRVISLAYRLKVHGLDPLSLLSELAGLEGQDSLAASQARRLGLIKFSGDRDGQAVMEPTDPLCRLLRSAPVGEDGLIECLIGKRAWATLELADFDEWSAPAALMRRILEGALESSTAGVNILLYGPPGSGKTELAKSLATAAGARLYAVGELDDYGDEPNRFDRVSALQLAQRVLANRRDSVLLFDEMEDLIGNAERAGIRDYFSRRDGSKVFVNRLFEGNPVPTLWTSNGIGNVDPAYMRRMSFVLRMDLPSPERRRQIIGRIAQSEGLVLSDAGAGRINDIAPEAMAVSRNALRAAKLARGDERDAARVAEALVAGLHLGRRPPPASDDARPLDLGLYHAQEPVASLLERLTAREAPLDFSLLLTGPPGTGKTALAHDLARRLDRPLVIKRVSDIQSMWIGQTEKRIAEAFAEAADKGQVLLFDEIDSLLFDRSTAVRSWEVSQVNELLTWMDAHPMPFVAATNHATKLDPAAMRRFVFKLALEALPPGKAARAFRSFFAVAPPACLGDVDGLTPGDFAVVARQLRFRAGETSPREIVELLAAEARAKPARLGRIGFRMGRPSDSAG